MVPLVIVEGFCGVDAGYFRSAVGHKELDLACISNHKSKEGIRVIFVRGGKNSTVNGRSVLQGQRLEPKAHTARAERGKVLGGLRQIDVSGAIELEAVVLVARHHPCVQLVGIVHRHVHGDAVSVLAGKIEKQIARQLANLPWLQGAIEDTDFV